MSSAAQLAANRKNALHSTGPRTQQGKHASSRNAVSHGLCSREFIVLDSDQAAFDELSSGLLEDLQPVSYLEHEIFLHILHAAWTIRRCRHAEFILVDSPDDPLAQTKHLASLKLIDTYARRAERTFHRSIKELRTIQTERLFRAQSKPEAIPDPVLVNHHAHQPKPKPKSKSNSKTHMIDGIALSPEAFQQAQSYIDYIMAPIPELPNKRTQKREG